MATTVTNPVPHQALYRRWRAQTFGQIIGQDAVVETLRNAVRLDRLSHGLLFVGPRGTGKTSMARIVAKAVNCLDPRDGEPDDECEPCRAIRDGRALDVVELDAASNNRVDDMRELLPRVYTTAADLRRKVFIIDEVQRIKEGWDVLLKTLEEPPPDVMFIFCTTDPSGIRPAVISRLQRFTFRPLPEGLMAGKLRRIADAEGRSVSDDAIELIAQRAAGGMRDAESMLDQVLASGADAIDANSVRDLLGLADIDTVDNFVTALATGDPLTGVRLLDDLELEGRDMVAFADQVVDRLRERLVAALVSPASARLPARALARAARRLAGLDVNRGSAGGYRLQLELALLEAAEPAMDQPAEPPPARQRAAEPPTADAPAPRVEARQAEVAEPVAVKQAEVAEPVGAQLTPVAVPVQSEQSNRSKSAKSEPSVPARSVAADEQLEQLRAAWPQVVEHVSRNPANRPLIAACRPVEIRDGRIILGFPESQAFLRDIAERKRSVLEEGLSAVLGRPVAVQCVATNIEMVEPAPADPGTEELVAHARRVFEDDLVDVAEVD
jgi:DNA polymerase-3 subunit gamma/tau